MSENESKPDAAAPEIAAAIEKTLPQEPPSLVNALSKMIAVWLGMLGLTITFVSGVLSGVEAPASLSRGVVAFMIFWVVGRIAGLFAGSAVKRLLAPPEVAETETAS